jgi:hypothetical protein
MLRQCAVSANTHKGYGILRWVMLKAESEEAGQFRGEIGLLHHRLAVEADRFSLPNNELYCHGARR